MNTYFNEKERAKYFIKIAPDLSVIPFVESYMYSKYNSSELESGKQDSLIYMRETTSNANGSLSLNSNRIMIYTDGTISSIDYPFYNFEYENMNVYIIISEISEVSVNISNFKKIIGVVF